MAAPRGYIFDFDGTLADSMWLWEQIDRNWLARRGIPYTEEYGQTISVLGFESGADFVIKEFNLDEKPEAIIEEWKGMAAEGYATAVELKPYAYEYLLSLKDAGYPLAIASSLQRHLLEACLHHNQIFELFDSVVVCEEVCSGGKKNPKVFQVAAESVGLTLDQCAVFEDIAIAANSAKSGGAYVVGVRDDHKHQIREELIEASDRFIDGFKELLDKPIAY